MKNKLIIILMVIIVLISCRHDVEIPDPAVLDTTIFLSGSVSGQAYPEFRTASMRLLGKPRNFILLEAYSTETCTRTESVSINDSLSGNTLFLEVIDNGPFSQTYTHRNLHFWLGPFNKHELYTINFIESLHAYHRDTLTYTFSFDGNIDTTISADTSVSMLSNTPLGSASIDYVSSDEISDSLYNKLLELEADSLCITEQINSFNVEIIINDLGCLQFNPTVSVSGDSLIMDLNVDASSSCDGSKFYIFNYFFSGYEGQGFHYRVDYGDQRPFGAGSILFEGNYNLP